MGGVLGSGEGDGNEVGSAGGVGIGSAGSAGVTTAAWTTMLIE